MRHRQDGLTGLQMVVGLFGDGLLVVGAITVAMSAAATLWTVLRLAI